MTLEQRTEAALRNWLDVYLWTMCAVFLVIAIYFIASGKYPWSSVSAVKSPVEYAAEGVAAEIDSWQRVLDARRQALKWAKAQGLVVDSVECHIYGKCDVVTHETTWGLRGCHRGECEIGSWSRPRPQSNWWIPGGASSSKCYTLEGVEIPCRRPVPEGTRPACWAFDQSGGLKQIPCEQ